MLLQLPFLFGAMWLVTTHDSPLGPWGRAAMGVAIWAVVIAWGRVLDASRLGNKDDLAARARGEDGRVGLERLEKRKLQADKRIERAV